MTLDSVLEWGLAIVGGGGIGSALTFLGNYKSRKKLEEELAKQATLTTENQHGIMERDRFEAMYKQITEMVQDYNDLSDQFREYRKTARSIEIEFDNKLRDKSMELACLKDEISHLKGLRCYDLECPKRIKFKSEK